LELNMAYPVVNAPYGLKPINLIGGQVFAGATRTIPIASGYATSIYYGDIVKFANGTIQRSALDYNDATVEAGTIGVFLGCTYTNPTTGQKIWTQYWTGGTSTADAEAIVVDDPDTLFQVVAVANSGSNVSTTVAAFGQVMVGSNCFPVTGNTANTLSGVSAIGVCLDASNARIITTTPFRIVALNPATAIATTATISATATSASQTLSAANSNIKVGMQISGTGVTAGTYVTAISGTALTASASITGVAGNTLTFAGAPEVIVKFNFGYHSYYNAAGV
jgi:hypothetical protein